MTLIRNGLPAIHPGAFLSEMLTELGLSQAAFARKIGVSAMRVSHIIGGRRPVTAEMALRLGRAFGQSAEYWLNLQVAYDLKVAGAELGKRLQHIEVMTSAA